MDVNNYYMAEVDTEYGNLHIVIPFPMLPEELKGFGAGNIIAGKLLISGDVCIDEYEKYAKGITNNKNANGYQIRWPIVATYTRTLLCRR